MKLNLDSVQEEIRSLEKVERSLDAPAALKEEEAVEEESHRMFDIGEPSEAASRNL